MPNIARTKPRPPARPQVSPSAKTKILLVRQPVKSVRRSDEPDRTPVRLAIGVIVALGVVAVVWLMGYLGWRLGFAPIMRVPDLGIEGAGGLATGTMMLIGLPRVILEAGMEQPMWLMVGFVAISIPAASLGGIKTPVRGGPRPNSAVVALQYTGAIFAMINAVGLMWWTVSPLRNAMVTELPYDAALGEQWLTNLMIVGGLDALGVVAAAVWVVVAMRLPVPLWLRALSSTFCMFVLVVMTVAFSITNATVAEVTRDRSVFFDDEGSVDPQLVVGFTPQFMVSLHAQLGSPLQSNITEAVEGEGAEFSTPAQPGRAAHAIIELSDRPARLTVVARQSVVDYLRMRVPREER